MVVDELCVPAIYLNPCRVIRNFNSTGEAIRTQRMTDAVKYTFYFVAYSKIASMFHSRLLVNY